MVTKLIDELWMLWKTKDAKTTSFVFTLITNYTINIYLMFIMITGLKHIFGNPIECFSDDPNKKYLKAAELKCWLEGVFLDADLMKAEVGTQVITYGVGPLGRDQTTFLTFKFYQWIEPLLMFQPLCLFLPRAIWRIKERGTMSKLLDNIYSPIFTDEWEKQRKGLITYIKDVRKKYHRQHAFNYLLCECLTIVVIIFNMLTLKFVINDFWVEYQPAVAALFRADLSSFNREAARLFPIQAKCKFNIFGPSGNLESRDALCILPQNVLNEKIFVFLYIWYIVLLICAILNVLYYLSMYLFKILRIFNIGHMLERSVTIRECKEISSNGDIGLWFTLSIYRRNMVSIYFQDLCRELHSELRREKSFENVSNSKFDDTEKYL